MNVSSCAAAVLLAIALGGCSENASPPKNPDRLWLALDGSETDVRLVPAEPPPY
jgi:hypothetical protein